MTVGRRWDRTAGRLLDGLAAAALGLSAAGMVAITAIIFASVVARYALARPLPWAEQASLAILLWMVLLGASAGVRQGFHIRISSGVDAMPAALRRLFTMLADLVVLVFAFAMIVWGIELARLTWAHLLPTLGLSRGFVYLALPLSGGLMALFTLDRLAGALGDRR